LFKIVSYFRHQGENKVMQTEDKMADTLDQHESAQSSSQQDDDKKPRSGADQLRLLGMPWGVKEKTRDGGIVFAPDRFRHMLGQPLDLCPPMGSGTHVLGSYVQSVVPKGLTFRSYGRGLEVRGGKRYGRRRHGCQNVQPVRDGRSRLLLILVGVLALLLQCI